MSNVEIQRQRVVHRGGLENTEVGLTVTRKMSGNAATGVSAGMLVALDAASDGTKFVNAGATAHTLGYGFATGTEGSAGTAFIQVSGIISTAILFASTGDMKISSGSPLCHSGSGGTLMVATAAQFGGTVGYAMGDTSTSASGIDVMVASRFV